MSRWSTIPNLVLNGVKEKGWIPRRLAAEILRFTRNDTKEWLKAN